VLQSGAKDVPSDRDRFLEHVAVDTVRLTRIARALLVLARAQSGESVTLEQLELPKLLESVVVGAGASAQGRISVACSPGLSVLAQPDLLREALAALVDNAVTHTSGAVRLAARKLDDAVEIEVVDVGEGIAPEHHARIFEPFYRVADTGEGFGLGLAIAQQAVNAMQGTLGIGVPDEGGTSFTIRLQAS